MSNNIVYPATGDGGGVWGEITGTLSSQTDLNSALLGKVDTDGDKVLSDNNYTDTDKSKVANVPSDTNSALSDKANETNINYYNSIVTKTASGNVLSTDVFKYVHFNSTSSITYTVQPNATTAIDVGTIIQLTNINTGSVTIAAGSGVTIRSKDGALDISGQYGEAVLRKIDTDEWILSGSIE